MDFDLFLTSPRWDILKIICEKPSSPVEIAEILNTTVSYVSQQLKLLDAANLLTKEKTGAFEKGKPRTLFSLTKELAYISILSKNMSVKKLVPITDYHKIILKIWQLNDPSFHYFFEKLFWKIEEDLDEVQAMFIDNSVGQNPKLLVVSESKILKLKLENYTKKFSKNIEVYFISEPQIKKFPFETLISLHDPNFFLERLKGGTTNNA